MSIITAESKDFDNIRAPQLMDASSYPTGVRLAQRLHIGERNFPVRPTSSKHAMGEKGVSGLKATPQPSRDIFGDFS